MPHLTRIGSLQFVALGILPVTIDAIMEMSGPTFQTRVMGFLKGL